MTTVTASSIDSPDFKANSPISVLSVKEKIGYGMGDAASNLYFQTFMLFIAYYYTDVFGISAASMGTMLLVTRIWDAINDPIMGIIADRTETKWGKFRPYIVSLAPVLALCGILAFYTPNLGANGKLLYAYVTYTLLMMLYTAVNVPYSALMGIMTPNSLERTNLSQYRFIFAFGGGIIVNSTALALVKFFGGGNEQIGWTWTMGVYGLLAVILFIFTFSSTKERVHPPKNQSTNTKQDLKDLFKNKPWILIAIVSISQLISVTMRSSSIPYYFKYYVLDQQLNIFSFKIDLTIEALISSFATIGSVSGVLGAFLAKFFVEKLGKKNYLMGAMIFLAMLSCCFYYISPQNALLLFSHNVVVNLFGGICAVVSFAIFADTADYGEWVYGRRATGLVMAGSLFSLKLGVAFAGTLVGWILEYHGFAANVVQTESSLFGIRLLMSYYPAVFGLIGGLIMIFYPLNEKIMVNIEQELVKRRG